jgi:hypothetical protein
LLVALSDGEPVLGLEVEVMVLVVDEARRRCEELHLREGLHFREVEVAPRAPE